MEQKGWIEQITDSDFTPSPQKVLITTPPRDIYADNEEMDHLKCLTPDGKIDSFAHHPQFIPDKYRNMTRQRPYDIAFLKENIEGPVFLELPEQKTIIEELATGRYDVLALSSYTWTIPWALDMAEMAKKEYGVREVWMGGYGVMTPEPLIRKKFDRLFWGYAESSLRQSMGLAPLPVEAIKHPELIAEIAFLGHTMKVGHLFWSRGCRRKCVFCADPVFQPGGENPFLLGNVHRIIDRYKRKGCISIHLVNQEVRPFSAMGEQVTDLLYQNNLRFSMMTSIAAINAKGVDGIKKLKDRGLTLVQLGIESLSDQSLTKNRKVSTVKKIEDTIALLRSLKIKVAGTYMLCFEDDTVRSIRQAKRRLCDLGMTITHFNIVIPMPGTQIYKDYHTRGLIRDWNWSHWSGEWLVWEHPAIAPQQARELLAEMDSEVNTPFYNLNLRKKWDRAEKVKTAS